MFPISKLYCFALLAGLVFSVVDARPLDPIEESGLILSARAVKAKETCAAKRKGAAAKAGNKSAAPAAGAAHGTGTKTKAHVHKVRRDGEFELNELFARTHPLPSGPLSLYHGTTEALEHQFDNFDITKSRQSGDFHFGKSGFYMTDKLDSAIEYACKSWCLEDDEMAVVIKFQWEGSPDTHHFDGQTEQWTDYQKWIKDGKNGNHTPHPAFDKIHNGDMVSGPMRSESDIKAGINEDFYQYVLTNPEAASKLKMIGKEEHKCEKHA
ncbi:hypothetical protein H0H93_004412, partial [Arthromyces matolae]